MKKIIVLALISPLLLMGQKKSYKMEKLNKEEIELIQSGDEKTMFRVLFNSNPEDEAILLKPSIPIDPKDKNISLLYKRMLETVNDPNHRGVGIAAPQIGLNRKVFLVKRLDKVGEPFEMCINPTITWYSDVTRYGKEGCLSIPGKSDMVYRSLIIRVAYTDLYGVQKDETIEGYTAVIFQHEYDHLLGILYPEQVIKQKVQTFKPALDKNELYYLNSN